MSPAPYLVKLLANAIPCESADLVKVQTSNGNTYFYDDTRSIIVDTEGNTIHYHGRLCDVKAENLPLYLEELFETVHLAKEKFNRDVDFDQKEDIIWTRF